jgi:hypothetical protein
MSLHADVDVPAHDRRRLERLCRHVARPPLAIDRLESMVDGRLAYRPTSRQLGVILPTGLSMGVTVEPTAGDPRTNSGVAKTATPKFFQDENQLLGNGRGHGLVDNLLRVAVEQESLGLQSICVCIHLVDVALMRGVPRV